MKTNLVKLILAGIAGAMLTPALQAQTSIFFVGGNASVKVIQNRWSTLFGGTLTANSTNANIFRYSGSSIPGHSEVGTVTADFNLTGGAGAILDLQNANTEVNYNNAPETPVAAISATAAETVGIDGTQFDETQTLVVPLVFAKNSNRPNSIAGITNLTQRQAYYLEQAAGALTTTNLGGSSDSDILYFVGRNDLSAVRQIIDANIFWTGPAANYTTNSNGSGNAVPYLLGSSPWGAGSGTEVQQILTNLNTGNAIGTVAAQDLGNLTPLSYEGVAFSTNNVINGSYPLWGYEQYFYYPTGTGPANAASVNQTTIINALISAVSDQPFEHTNSVFIGKFVSIQDLLVARGVPDGGPITDNGPE
jgi:hypothetical protein